MPRLLVIHHTTSPATEALLDAAVRGATAPEVEGVETVRVPALAVGVPDVLAADGYLLATPANLGYISGALKHAFDVVYYPVRDATQGRPYAAVVHGNNDTGGAIRAIDTITTGLGWRQVAATLSVIGEPSKADLESVWELAATVAATLLP